MKELEFPGALLSYSNIEIINAIISEREAEAAMAKRKNRQNILEKCIKNH